VDRLERWMREFRRDEGEAARPAAPAVAGEVGR
jgi:hypothetical protein